MCFASQHLWVLGAIHVSDPEQKSLTSHFVYDWVCTGLQDGERKVELLELPQCLILSMMRFAYDRESQTRKKLLNKIPIKERIMVPVCPNGGATMHVPYALAAVVVHSGTSPNSGHYFTYGIGQKAPPTKYKARSDSATATSPSPTAASDSSAGVASNPLWHLYNDSNVCLSSVTKIERAAHMFPRDTPYVLLYQRDMSADAHSSLPVSNASALKVEELRSLVAQDNIDMENEMRKEAARPKTPAYSTGASWYNHPGGSNGRGDPPAGAGGMGGGMAMHMPRMGF